MRETEGSEEGRRNTIKEVGRRGKVERKKERWMKEE